MYLRIYRPFLIGFFLFICICLQVSGWNLMGYEIKLKTKNPECCDKDWIKFDELRLNYNLKYKVYGQPLLDTVVNALAAHFYYPPSKALVLSFHGMTGTGKNYVSKFIAESIYKQGMKSKYVHSFIGRIHFSEESKVNEYRNNLNNWLQGNITDCSRQLFIFDEVDKMIPNVFNNIKPMLDYHDNVDGTDYSKAIFVFLSNVGSDIIREHYHDLYTVEARNREDLTLSDFESFIQKAAFNEEGGFYHSDAITNNLVDHYIPFLPLEKKHIIRCIKREFEKRDVSSPKQEHIEEVLKIIEWGPDNSKLFSKTGCKRIGPKVALLVDKHYRHFRSNKRKDEF